MPRKSRSYDKHTPLPDPKYGSVKYAKFINYIMERGKKNVARKIFYDALDIVTEKMAQQEIGTAKNSPDPSLSTKGHELAGPKVGLSPTNGRHHDLGSASQDFVGGGEKRGDTAATDKPQQKLDGRQVFDFALKNVCPIMEIKGRRIGGSNYQVPMEVMEPRKTTLGMRWLLAAAKSKKGMRMAERLAAEIMDAYNKQGGAIKKREDVHRMAEANKAFAHFARFGRR